MRKVCAVLTIALVLTGCGQTQSKFSGAVLGWNSHLYRLTTDMKKTDIGKELAVETYHGTFSGAFTIFEIRNSSPSQEVAFESRSGEIIKGVVTK